MGDISGLVESEEESEQPTEVEEVAPVQETSEIDFQVEAAPTVTVNEPKPTGEPNFLDVLLNKIEPIDSRKTHLKMMIYSDPGAGKTTFLGQIPNNLIIDAEAGTDSILNNKEIMGKGVARLPYKSFLGLEKTVEEFHKNHDQLKRFETISIDSMSNLHKRGLAEVVKREWEKNPTLNNRYVAETEHHTENNEHIRQLVQDLCDLRMNFVMTAHKRTITPKNDPDRTFPDFSEKLANTLAGMMDVVAYMYIARLEDGEEHRVLKFHPSEGISAKCRLDHFPDNMVDPTWEKVQELLNQV